MNVKLLSAGILLVAVMVLCFSGCTDTTLVNDYEQLEVEHGDLQVKYDALEAEVLDLTQVKIDLESEVKVLKDKCAELEGQKPQYFPSRNAIVQWLSSVPKLGISSDVYEWYLYGLYYQQKAADVGYIVSVAYWQEDKTWIVWCEVVTIDGYIYYFDPDDCILQDTSYRVEIERLDGELGNTNVL